MNDNTLCEFHYFVLTDYEEEEVYLREMHKNGWKFIRVTLPGFYHFEKCEPEDVVYRLDFNPKPSREKENYIRLYEDYGWEYLQDMSEYSYFRKPAAEADTEADTEIFSDNASKLDMLQRIFAKRMLPILAIFLCCMIPNVSWIISLDQAHPLEYIFFVLLIALFSLYIGIIIRCLTGFHRLNKKYSNKDS